MNAPSIGARIVRAIATIEHMLKSRGECVDGIERLGDEDISNVISSSETAFVNFDTGARDIVFFTKKLKTADIAKAAIGIPDERKGNVILVSLDALMTVHARSIAMHFGPTCEIFALPALGVDIAQSNLVPKHALVPKAEHANLKERLGVATLSQLPLIESGDPMAKYVRARPGDVVKITRLHPSAGHQIAYRFCRK
jgi:DNA-directed RNA polymerase subunit H